MKSVWVTLADRSSKNVGLVSKACGRYFALIRSNSSLVRTHLLLVPQLVLPQTFL